MKNYIGLIILLFSTYGCFIADEAINNKSDYSGSLSSKVKNAISQYIKDEYPNSKYYKYGYSNLIIHKPVELIMVDSLKLIKPKTIDQQKNIQHQTDSLKQLINNNNIKYWLEMDHVFNIKNKNSNNFELYEVKFYLNDSVKVERTKPLMFLNLTPNQEVIYSDFFFEYPIFKANSYVESQNLSHNFYTYFKLELENRRTLTEKSNFLKHIIWICEEVKTEGQFIQEDILKKLTIINMSKNKQIKSYNPIKFSRLFEIKEDKVLRSFYFFHKFNHLNANNTVEDAVYVGFSPYYELTDVLQLEKPIEQYFNE